MGRNSEQVWGGKPHIVTVKKKIQQCPINLNLYVSISTFIFLKKWCHATD